MIKLALYILAVGAVPNIFLSFVYNNNRVINDLAFSHVAWLMLIFLGFSAGLFLILRLAVKSYAGAFFVSVLFWLGFWFFEVMYGAAAGVLPELGRPALLLGIAGALIPLTLLLSYKSQLFAKADQFVLNITPAILILFLFNFGTSFYYGFVLERLAGAEQSHYIRRDFHVDNSLPTPNIYWFHMDGMMNFDTPETLWGDSQPETREALSSRGFKINYGAHLYAVNTYVALPVLFSPHFYDITLRERLARYTHLRNHQRSVAIMDGLLHDGYRMTEDIIVNAELIRALQLRGYTTVAMGAMGWLPLWQNFNYYYYVSFSERELADDNPFLEINSTEHAGILYEARYLLQLLTMLTPLSIWQDRLTELTTEDSGLEWIYVPDHMETIAPLLEATLDHPQERRFYRNLVDVSGIEGPKFVLIANEMTHGLQLDEDSPWVIHDEAHGRHPRDFLNYMPIHRYAVRSMLNMVDIVLENDPEAAIVIQSDHGIHIWQDQEVLLYNGITPEELQEIMSSTISAVRIPESLGGLETPPDPRDISRLLVNRFVGQNYAMAE
ncbi:MAG: hypothetical protein FWD98_01270 [Defluviitaleaceae bacterium]|nr:hypothetical protein [Defluviitaleaceae bacterium]